MLDEVQVTNPGDAVKHLHTCISAFYVKYKN